MAVTNWHDVLKFQGFDGGKEIADEVRLAVPEFTGTDGFGSTFDISRGQSITDQDFIEGLIRKEETPADPFRNVNEGLVASKGVYERTLFKLCNAGGFVQYDRALIDRDKTRGGLLMRAEAVRVLEDAIRALGTQFFYGGSADGGASDKGFQGLEAFVGSGQTVSAGGSAGSGSTTGLTSAYFVKFSEVNGVCWLFGRGGSFDLSDIERAEIPDPADSTKLIPVYRQLLEFYPGLAFNSKYAAARIANIQTSSTATPANISTTAFTDTHLLVALDAFKGDRPDALFMSRKAGLLLGASRVPSVTISGKTIVSGGVDVPREFYGIPILYTDSLTANEAAWS